MKAFSAVKAFLTRTPTEKPTYIKGGVWDLDDMPAGAAFEPGIKPLVERMNATGRIRTVASCQGHVWRTRAPYVYFKTEVGVAAAIERRLRNASDTGTPPWLTGFQLSAMFNQDHELAFSLQSSGLNNAVTSSIRMWWCIGHRRRKLDRELSWVADVIEEAVLAYSRNEVENQNGCSKSQHDKDNHHVHVL